MKQLNKESCVTSGIGFNPVPFFIKNIQIVNYFNSIYNCLKFYKKVEKYTKKYTKNG